VTAGQGRLQAHGSTAWTLWPAVYTGACRSLGTSL